MKDGPLRLGSCHGAATEYHGLKGPFLPGATAIDQDRSRAVAFVALVLRYCRTFLHQEHQSLIQGRRLAWVLNIGCPTNIYDAEKLSEDYRRMFLIAWVISQSSEDIRLRDVMAALEGPAKSLEQVGLDSIEAISGVRRTGRRLCAFATAPRWSAFVGRLRSRNSGYRHF
jgi:hypothetical protein